MSTKCQLINLGQVDALLDMFILSLFVFSIFSIRQIQQIKNTLNTKRRKGCGAVEMFDCSKQHPTGMNLV